VPVTSVKPSVLVLGGTGMLGHAVVEQLVAADFDVHASVRSGSPAARLEGSAALHFFDATRDSLVELVDELRPASVINCIGVIKQLDEGSMPLPAIALNALFPHRVAAACETINARLIHISTDCVFSGALPIGQKYTEDDVADARDLYGLTKYLGEVHTPVALTLRTSIIGWELERSTGLLEWFAGQAGQRVNGFTHAIFSGLTTRALAVLIVRLIAEQPQLSGLYHVASEPLSKYELLLALRERLALDVELVPVDEPVINRALSSDRLLHATGLEAPSWEDMLAVYTSEPNWSANAR
jgi:dTDP-4-dehydrorhamnose reductase